MKRIPKEWSYIRPEIISKYGEIKEKLEDLSEKLIKPPKLLVLNKVPTPTPYVFSINHLSIEEARRERDRNKEVAELLMQVVAQRRYYIKNKRIELESQELLEQRLAPQLTYDDINSITNQDIKTLALRVYGINKFMQNGGGQLVMGPQYEGDYPAEVWALPVPGRNGKRLLVLKCKTPSVHDSVAKLSKEEKLARGYDETGQEVHLVRLQDGNYKDIWEAQKSTWPHIRDKSKVWAKET